MEQRGDTRRDEMEVIVDTTKGVYKERIVRCRECLEYDDDWCMYWQNVINPDDFCSYGEREGE